MVSDLKAKNMQIMQWCRSQAEDERRELLVVECHAVVLDDPVNVLLCKVDHDAVELLLDLGERQVLRREDLERHEHVALRRAALELLGAKVRELLERNLVVLVLVHLVKVVVALVLAQAQPKALARHDELVAREHAVLVEVKVVKHLADLVQLLRREAPERTQRHLLLERLDLVAHRALERLELRAQAVDRVGRERVRVHAQRVELLVDLLELLHILRQRAEDLLRRNLRRVRRVAARCRLSHRCRRRLGLCIRLRVRGVSLVVVRLRQHDPRLVVQRALDRVDRLRAVRAALLDARRQVRKLLAHFVALLDRVHLALKEPALLLERVEQLLHACVALVNERNVAGATSLLQHRLLLEQLGVLAHDRLLHLGHEHVLKVRFRSQNPALRHVLEVRRRLDLFVHLLDHVLEVAHEHLAVLHNRVHLLLRAQRVFDPRLRVLKSALDRRDKALHRLDALER
ncbi:hypothetical protein PybrP1_000035 [[Pythium] brassicae (nom. inval.)]|nr:hypothetical protein PybrP1_000035 [[Pythium] brassicae (nom. inval.)]